jgi:hypothetical protein
VTDIATFTVALAQGFVPILEGLADVLEFFPVEILAAIGGGLLAFRGLNAVTGPVDALTSRLTDFSCPAPARRRELRTVRQPVDRVRSAVRCLRRAGQQRRQGTLHEPRRSGQLRSRVLLRVRRRRRRRHHAGPRIRRCCHLDRDRVRDWRPRRRSRHLRSGRRRRPRQAVDRLEAGRRGVRTRHRRHRERDHRRPGRRHRPTPRSAGPGQQPDLPGGSDRADRPGAVRPSPRVRPLRQRDLQCRRRPAVRRESPGGDRRGGTTRQRSRRPFHPGSHSCRDGHPHRRRSRTRLRRRIGCRAADSAFNPRTAR